MVLNIYALSVYFCLLTCRILISIPFLCSSFVYDCQDCNLHAREVYENRPKRETPSVPTQQTVGQTGADGRAADGAIASDSTINRPSNAVRSPTAAPTNRTSSTTVDHTTSAAAAPASFTAKRPDLSSASSSRQQQPTEPKKPENDWFEEIKDDVVKIIKRAQAKDGDIIEATNKAKEHWKNQRSAMEMTKREFNSVWTRVKEEISTMPELSQDNNDTSEAKSAANDESETNRWSSIWEPGGTYEFGDWDTYVEVSSDEE